MNKSELAVKLAKKVGLTQVKAAEIVDAIFNAHKGIVASVLKEGKKVTIPGFGTFSTRKRAARQGATPRPARASPSRPGSMPPSRQARRSRRSWPSRPAHA